jgi:serine/threonine protein kinase
LYQSNILIDANGTASLCDFGLSTILAEFHGTSLFTSTISGSVRWTAPELYEVTDGTIAIGLTTQSDIYSFGSVMLQVSVYLPFAV